MSLGVAPWQRPLAVARCLLVSIRPLAKTHADGMVVGMGALATGNGSGSGSEA